MPRAYLLAKARGEPLREERAMERAKPHLVTKTQCARREMWQTAAYASSLGAV